MFFLFFQWHSIVSLDFFLEIRDGEKYIVLLHSDDTLLIYAGCQQLYL